MYKIRAVQPVAVIYNAAGIVQNVRIAVLTLTVEYAYRLEMYPNTFSIKATAHTFKMENGKCKVWKLCLSKLSAGEEVLYFSIARLKLTNIPPSVTVFDIDVNQPKTQYEKQLLRRCFHCWPEHTLNGLYDITRILADGRVLNPHIYQCITNIEPYIQAAEARQAGKTVTTHYERIAYPEPYRWYLDYTGTLHSWTDEQHLPLSEAVHKEMKRCTRLQTLASLDFRPAMLSDALSQEQDAVCYFGNVWLNQSGRFCLTQLLPITEGDDYATHDYIKSAVEMQRRYELLGQKDLKIKQYYAYGRHHHLTTGRLEGTITESSIIAIPNSVRALKLDVNAPVRIKGHENILSYTVECRNKAVLQVDGITDVQECQVIAERSTPQPNGDPIWLPESINGVKHDEALGFNATNIAVTHGQYITSTWNTSKRFFATNNFNLRFGNQLYDNIVFNAAGVNEVVLKQERKQMGIMLCTQGEISDRSYLQAHICFSADEEQCCLFNVPDVVSNIEYTTVDVSQSKQTVKHTTINLLHCENKSFKSTIKINPRGGRHVIHVLGKAIDCVQCDIGGHRDDCNGYAEIHYMGKVTLAIYSLILWIYDKQFPWKVHIYFHEGLGRLLPSIGYADQKLLRNKAKMQQQELFVDKSVIIHVPRGTKQMLLGVSTKHASAYMHSGIYTKNTAKVEESKALSAVLQQVIVDDL